jgi:ankyrin repeat protein
LGLAPIHYAAKAGHKPIVSLLLERDTNIEQKSEVFGDMTPLHLAAENGHIDVASYLLEKGANLHIKDKVDRINH